MLDTFESPQDGFGVAGAGDTRMGDAGQERYAAAGPTESDDPEDEILEDDLGDDDDDLDDDVDFDDEDDDGDDEDDIDDEEDDLDDDDDEDDLDDDLDDDLVDLDDEYDTEDVERHHRGPGRGKYEDY
jgi:hypothetical protein